MEKLHNLVYKTTDLINGYIYIGVHRTNNLNDGYIGCGICKQQHVNTNKSLKSNNYFHNAVRKHGYENFIREILYNVDNSELAFFIEELIVDEEFIKRKDVYNRRTGGCSRGGKFSEASRKKMSISQRTKIYRPNATTRKLMSDNTRGENNPFFGKSFSEESLKKMRSTILCITTNEIFIGTKAVLEKYPKSSKVSECCLGTRKYAGKLPDGRKLEFKYLNRSRGKNQNEKITA